MHKNYKNYKSFKDAFDSKTQGIPFVNDTDVSRTSKKDTVMDKHNIARMMLPMKAPGFQGTAVVNGEFREISLADFCGKYLVLFFYPMDFTLSPTEIIAFSDRVDEFRKINCEVIACSVDSHFSHLSWINTPKTDGGLGRMKIPMLSDPTKEISKAYGVFKEDEGIAYRGLFIIDDKGSLRQITINDMSVERSVDETLRLVRASQVGDKILEDELKTDWNILNLDPKRSKE